MQSLAIDHVTIAGSALAPLRERFAALGLTTEYGGPHSNGVTHMDLLGFDDGSYIELISSLEPGQMAEDDAFWGKQILGDGGPCAWAVRVEDIAAEAQRIADVGISVDGPTYYHRQRPDGQLVEWELAFLGDKGAGAQLPFLIQDITPRSLRVQPSASVANGPLTGISIVILAVSDLETATSLFQRVYGWATPQMSQDDTLGATLAYFPETPVMLAAPRQSDNRLAKRLARFGESPCAYLIGANDFEAARRHFPLSQPATIFGRPIAWFDPDRLGGQQLGVIG